MVTFNEFIEKLREDFPEFNFKQSSKFLFRPPKTIHFELNDDPNSKLLLLHELGHAILEHKNFYTDIERIKKESDAWQKARELAEIYNVEIDEEEIESELDTYRNWLHQKSKCKKCGITMFQTVDGVYHCPHCDKKALE